MLTNTQIACASLGLKPEDFGSPATEHFRCVKCAGDFPAGTRRSPFRVTESFVDEHSLAGRNHPVWECAWCAPFSMKSYMDKTQNAMLTPTDSFSMRKAVHRQWVLRNLPEPPFLIVLSDTKLAHLLWRTPITRSKDLLHVRMGARLWTVKMPIVRAVCEELAKLERRGSPFVSFDSHIRDLASGQFWPETLKKVPRLAQLANYLGQGEWWALLTLSQGENPEKPGPINLGENPESPR